MAIIKQHDKRSGITYVYESRSYWDPEALAHSNLHSYENSEILEILIG